MGYGKIIVGEEWIFKDVTTGPGVASS